VQNAVALVARALHVQRSERDMPYRSRRPVRMAAGTRTHPKRSRLESGGGHWGAALAVAVAFAIFLLVLRLTAG
jgi:hypothetical protein